jgi:hypothetical protein
MVLVDLKNTLIELIDNLVIRVESIKDLFHHNEIQEGLNRLYIFTEDVTALTEGLAVIDPDQSKFRIADINQQLNDVLTAFESHDPLYAADILEQEIIPLLMYWKEILS